MLVLFADDRTYNPVYPISSRLYVIQKMQPTVCGSLKISHAWYVRLYVRNIAVPVVYCDKEEFATLCYRRIRMLRAAGLHGVRAYIYLRGGTMLCAAPAFAGRGVLAPCLQVN